MGRSSVEELVSLILGEVPVLRETEQVPVPRAVGRALSADVTAPVDLPSFTRSAVDGYAVNSEDLRAASGETPVTLRVVEKVTAGHVPQAALGGGEAALTTTGAMLPEGADAVILVEEASRTEEDRVVLTRSAQPGQHVSPVGEDFQKGQQLLSRGHLLRLVDVAALAALGITRVPVVRRPRVAIYSTGDELVSPGDRLGPAQVYDSNAYLLEAAVLEAGGDPHRLGALPDEAEDVEAYIYRACSDGAFDLLVTTGGTGASLLVLEGQDVENIHDLIPAVVAKLGRLKSHGLRMIPGKPTAFGEVAGKPVFSLAGWPYSAIMTFHLFVRPAIRKMAGLPPLSHERTITARLTQAVETEEGTRKYFQVRMEERDGQWWAQPLLPPRPPSAARTMRQMLEGNGYFHLDGTQVARLGEGDTVQVTVDDPAWT